MQIIEGRVCVFSQKNTPIAHAKAGEILEFHTKDCFGGQISREDQVVDSIDFDYANPTAGPVYVDEAKAGDVLVVDILDIEVADKGIVCTLPDMGPLCHKCELITKIIEVKDDYINFNGISIKTDPMIGVIGVAPKGDDLESGFADRHGGNMDSRLIKKGARVYLPVSVDGALLQMGDVHAIMGDGELCGTGVEIDATIIARVGVIKNFELNWPVTLFDNKWYVNSKGVNYDESLIEGVGELSRLIQQKYGWPIEDVAVYFTLAGSVEVNQGLRPDPHDGMVNLRLSIPNLEGKELIK